MRNQSIIALVGALSLCSLSACTPVPREGTSVTSSSEAFSRFVRDIEGDCARMGGCTCIMDGVQTTCPIVFACLEAGFCVLVEA